MNSEEDSTTPKKPSSDASSIEEAVNELLLITSKAVKKLTESKTRNCKLYFMESIMTDQVNVCFGARYPVLQNQYYYSLNYHTLLKFSCNLNFFIIVMT